MIGDTTRRRVQRLIARLNELLQLKRDGGLPSGWIKLIVHSEGTFTAKPGPSGPGFVWARAFFGPSVL